MRIHIRIATGAAIIALGVAPGWAFASRGSAPGQMKATTTLGISTHGQHHGHGSGNAANSPGHTGDNPGHDGKSHKPSSPGVKAGEHAKAKAYGRYCKGESKKHVSGIPGTPFSACVTAMAKLESDSAKTARAACATLSKKHVRGERGTAFSRCISGAAKLLKQRNSSGA